MSSLCVRSYKDFLFITFRQGRDSPLKRGKGGNMKVYLRDSVKEYDAPVTVEQIAADIGEGLHRAALAGKVNGKPVDLSYVVSQDAEVQILTFKDQEGKHIYNHTAAHVMAQAVKSIYPTAKLAIGPAIDTGFYYDIDYITPPTMEDLAKIEEEMQRIIKANLPIRREVLPRKNANALMRKLDEPYKLEMIAELPRGSEISFYHQGDFVDMCVGPHLKSTGVLKAVKLTSITGAYWRGDANNKMLTRIYGVAFDKKSALDEYLTLLEEAKKRDHNKLGRDLGIFMTEEKIGQGLPLLMPKGAKMLQVLQRFVEDEEERRGFMLTKTPAMAKNDLYKISGHWDHYRDKMFVIGDEEKDDEVLALRPMTCPFQYQIYKNGIKSYRDLPCRYAETATLFRNEASGEMHGLIRVRQFTLSDGHIVCMPEQIEEEFRRCLDLSYYFLNCLGLRDAVTFRFSKWDPKNTDKYIDNPSEWERTETLMKGILDRLGLDYVEAVGEAAFYGPKLDVQAKNVYGKEDTIITIQIDFASAARFEMTYVDENGVKKTPYIIHRSSIGCYERTLAMLIEKYAGAFPTWIAPTQVTVISLTDRTAPEVKELADKLNMLGFRADSDTRSEKVGYKIREAQLAKVPYMLIIGDKEKEEGKVSVRHRTEGDLGVMTIDEFVALLEKDIREKILK